MPNIDIDITHQKYLDIMAAYRKLAPTCTTQQQVWLKLAACPAPRFYVTHFQAYQRMLQFFKGDKKIKKLPLTRKRLYEALYDVCLKLSQQRQYLGLSLYQLVQYAIVQPAPSFFVAPSSMPRLFKKAKQFERDKNQRFQHFYKTKFLKENGKRK